MGAKSGDGVEDGVEEKMKKFGGGGGQRWGVEMPLTRWFLLETKYSSLECHHDLIFLPPNRKRAPVLLPNRFSSRLWRHYRQLMISPFSSSRFMFPWILKRAQVSITIASEIMVKFLVLAAASARLLHLQLSQSAVPTHPRCSK
jgi:hypothetical protein